MARRIWCQGQHPTLWSAVDWVWPHNPNRRLGGEGRPISGDLAELVRSLPNDLDREGWVRAGIAMFAEFGPIDGYALFLEFSRKSPRHHNERTVAQVWRSIEASPPRRITGATLRYLAGRGR